MLKAPIIALACTFVALSVSAQTTLKDGPSIIDHKPAQPPATSPISPASPAPSTDPGTTTGALITPSTPGTDVSKLPLNQPGKVDLGKPPSEQIAALGQRIEEPYDTAAIALWTLAGALIVGAALLGIWAWREHRFAHFVRR